MAIAEIIKQEIVNGVPVVRFFPSPAMRVFAMTAFCDPELAGKTPEEICRSAGISPTAYRRFLDYEPHFSEWLEGRRMELGGKNKKALLEAVGMEMALKGEFNFWKPLALREGVIENDRLEVGLSLPCNLSAYDNLTDEQLSHHRDSLLQSLRGMEDARPIDLVETPLGWERESSPAGAPPLPEERVALPESVGDDRERGLEDF